MKLNKVDEQVIKSLKIKESTLAELEEQTGLPSKKVFKSLRKLLENEMIDSKARKYRLLTDKPPVKGKEADSAEEE
jgi:predicted transcriptional regulator